MARLDALRLARDLKQRVLDFSNSDVYMRDPELQRHMREVWASQPSDGGLLTDLWVEASWPAQSSQQTPRSMAQAGLLPMELMQHLDKRGALPLDRRLYVHQAAAVEASQQPGARPSIIVTAGTGAGKTESFLLPMLNQLWQPAQGGAEGIRALILYPMNALVNDQVDRLYQWLQGQRTLRFAHFTSETPEDRAAADRAGFKRFDAARCRTRKEARGLESPEGKPVAAGERRPVPDILITNYSMLEYMLARPQDRVFFGSNLEVVILDEAHLYTGTLAAEITLLMRRLLDRCDRSSDQVLQLATSATIGRGTAAELQEFSSILFSKDPARCRVIQGKEAPPAIVELRPPARPVGPEAVASLPELETIRLLRVEGELTEELIVDAARADSLRAELSCLCAPPAIDSQEPLAVQLARTLPGAPLVKELETVLRKHRFQPLDQLAESLFPHSGASGQEATLRLLGLVAAARTSLTALPLLPHRLHLMVRASEGFTCCLNPQCDGPAQGRWACLGAIQPGNCDTCAYCGSLCLTLMRCGNCGEAALGADTTAGQMRPFQARRWEKRQPAQFYSLPGKTEFLVRIDTQKRRRQGDGQTSGSQLSEVKQCPNCEAKLSHFETLVSNGSLILSIVAETILAGVPPLTGQLASSDILPAAGRRLLAFSDSRAEAARLGPRLRRQHEMQLVRAALVDMLAGEDGPDPELMSYWEDKVSQAQEELASGRLSPAMSKQKQKDLGEGLKQLRSYKQGGPLVDWAERLAEHKLMFELLDPEQGQKHEVSAWTQWVWEDNRRAASQSSLLRLGLELASPDRRKGSNLESIGWVEVTYPHLDSLEPPTALLGTMPAQARAALRAHWTPLLSVLLDTLRLEHCITLGTRELDLEWQQGSFPFGRWLPIQDFVGKTERKRRREFVADVLVQTGLPREEANTWSGEVLEEAFTQLFERAQPKDEKGSQHSFPWLHAWEGYHVDQVPTRALRLVFPELAMRRPGQMYRCTCTGRVWARSVLGCAPDPGSRGTLEPVTTEVLDQLASVGRARREYAESAVFRMGLWAEEHSAQLSPREGRRLQELFRAGMRNILSATTTMELGIDIGGLSAAFLSNVPPGKANYLQRAGRVGRRADGSSIVVTAARGRPYDREVFLRLGDFLRRDLRRPRIFLERKRVVERHLHAWLMGGFFAQLYQPQEHRGAMSAFGQMGNFAGRMFPQYWEPKVPRPLLSPPDGLQQFPRPAWWDYAAEKDQPGLVPQFLAWVEAVRGSREQRSRLTHLFRDTVLEVETHWEALMERAEEVFNAAVKHWCEDYDTLLGGWGTTENTGLANKLRYAMMDMHRCNVIEVFSNAQFLPRYGFPIGLLQLKVMTKTEDGRTREEESYRLERSGLLALGEYVPGSQLLVGGKLVTSRGLLKHWTGENLDNAFGPSGHSTTCAEAGHTYYWIAKDPGACPFCGDEGRNAEDNLLFPRYGFTTADWDPPRYSTDVERVGSVQVMSITFAQSDGKDDVMDENLAGISGLVARYREGGELLVTNRGDNCGFAICTKCGFADAEKHQGTGRDKLPKQFTDHWPLTRSGKGSCWSAQEGPVLRNQVLAAKQPTDVLLLNFSKLLCSKAKNQDLMLTLGLGLQQAGAQLLDLDSRELGVLLVPSDHDHYAPVLYDNTPGGAGHVLELYRQAAAWLEATRQLLRGSDEHNERCHSACLDCLMSIDAQYHLSGTFVPKRREALAILEKHLAVLA